jgi:hypothetical protein
MKLILWASGGKKKPAQEEAWGEVPSGRVLHFTFLWPGEITLLRQFACISRDFHGIPNKPSMFWKSCGVRKAVGSFTSVVIPANKGLSCFYASV